MATRRKHKGHRFHYGTITTGPICDTHHPMDPCLIRDVKKVTCRECLREICRLTLRALDEFTVRRA